MLFLSRLNHNLMKCYKNPIRCIGNIQLIKTEEDIANKRKLMAMFPNVLQDLSDFFRKECPVSGVPEYLTEVINYNVPLGKQFRALSLVSTYRSLVKPRDLTDDKVAKSFLMAWCVEMAQCFYVLSDDIMDGSESRRGKLCWYKREDVGLNAIADGLLIENCAVILLKKYFDKEAYYMPAADVIHNMSQRTGIGQIMDYQSMTSDGRPNYQQFKMDVFELVAQYKTSYHAFEYPNMLAFLMAGIDDPAIFDRIHDIWMKMGIIYQLQNDYMDAYGDPNITGKKGNDIFEGKFSWFAVAAMERGSEQQRQIMEEHYGVFDPESERIVYALYNDLGLEDAYHKYEDGIIKSICEQIKQVPEIPSEVFFNNMRRFLGRDG